MTRISHLATGTALASILTAGAATADVTGPEVWADLKAYYDAMGYAISGTETQTAGTLTVGDVVFTVDLPDDGAVVRVAVPDMVFVDQGDGTVDMDTPLTYPMTLSGLTTEGETLFEATVTMVSDKLDMTVSGTPGALSYVTDGDGIKLTLDKLIVDGEDATGIMTIAMAASQLDGTTALGVGNMLSNAQDIAMGDVSLDVAFDDPDTGDTGAFGVKLADVAFASKTVLPRNYDPQDPMAFLAKGVEALGSFSMGASRTTFDIDAEGDRVQGQTGSEATNMSFALKDQKVNFAFDGKGVKANMIVPDLPFPIEYAMGGYQFSLALPFGKSEEPQGFGTLLRLSDVTMSDLLWSLFDAGNQLPRDPITVLADVSGEATVLADLNDPEQLQMVERGQLVPAQVDSLNVNSLVVDAVGAKLTGDAAFELDNTDLETYDGIPKPVGAANITITGVNKLIDTLVNMGLVPQEQAMGARMMMSMFAQPAGEDALSSRIEMNEQGHVLANGQRIR